MSPFIRPHSVRRADRHLARAVLLVALAVLTATFAGLPDNPDAEVEFQTVHALHERRSLALGGTPEAELIVAQGFAVREGAGERAGQHYSWFGVGQALVALPFFAAGRLLARALPELQARHAEAVRYGIHRSEYFEHLLVGWRNPLLGALTASLVVLAARRVGASRPSAFYAGLGYALCSFAWPQARSTLNDVQATFLTFLALDLLLRFREALERGTRPRLAQVAGFGACLGLAFLTRAATAPAIAVLLVLFAAVLARAPVTATPRRRALQLAFAIGPAALGLALWLLLNERRFGDPLESGYGGTVTGAFFDHPPLLGLVGLFVSPSRGLLWLAPPLVLALVGWPRAWRSGDGLIAVGLPALALAALLPYAATAGWHGGWTYGPRYVLPALPVLFLLVAHGLDRVGRRRSGRLLSAALLGLGLSTSLPGVLVDPATHLDLALQAQRLEWPDPPGETEVQDDDARFTRIQWEWRYAAPWAHWRILRHRVAGIGEEYSPRELYFLDRDEPLRPSPETPQGFRHLAWVDFVQRLGGPAWPAVLLVLALLVAGGASALRGFDPTLR